MPWLFLKGEYISEEQWNVEIHVQASSHTLQPPFLLAFSHLKFALRSPLLCALVPRFFGGGANPFLQTGLSCYLSNKTEILQLAQALLSVKKMPQDISKVCIFGVLCSSAVLPARVCAFVGFPCIAVIGLCIQLYHFEERILIIDDESERHGQTIWTIMFTNLPRSASFEHRLSIHKQRHHVT